MIIASDVNALSSIDPSICSLVGFHATSTLACQAIERNGFLPNKILEPAEHDLLMALAHKHELDTSSYSQWLDMRSVTFARSPDEALRHIQYGFSGGQGLHFVSEVLAGICLKQSAADHVPLSEIREKVEAVRAAAAVVYAVCLCELGPRLANDKAQNVLHYYWNPNASLPATSEISPDRILVKYQSCQ